MTGPQIKATGKGRCNSHAVFSILLNNGNESLHLIPDTMEKNLKFIALRVLPEMLIIQGFAYWDLLSYLCLSSIRRGPHEVDPSKAVWFDFQTTSVWNKTRTCWMGTTKECCLIKNFCWASLLCIRSLRGCSGTMPKKEEVRTPSFHFFHSSYSIQFLTS